MCGIIGVLADRDVVPLLLNGLKRMEYRGYDSAGIAVRPYEPAQGIMRVRAPGKIAALQRKIDDNPIHAFMGIGHTRWATHGEATEVNAHPHRATQVTIVHNGIIENWHELKQELLNQGYVFSSDTDSEVVAYLIQSKLDKGLSERAAFSESIKRLMGAYAIAVLIESAPDTLFVARLGCPLVVGEANGEKYVGSDALALAPLTQQIRYLEEGDYAILNKARISIYDHNDTLVERQIVNIGQCNRAAEKGEFAHYMLKEIHEQPGVVRALIASYINIKTKTVKPMPVSFDPERIDKMVFTACGSAYIASMLAKNWIETLAKLNVDVDFASEYRYRDLVQPANGVLIAVSQSGETADTLAALRRAKAENQHIVGLVNVETSTVARESHDMLPVLAGAEIGVASTKAFIAQTLVILCLAIWLGRRRGVLSSSDEQALITALLRLPQQMQAIIERPQHIQQLGQMISPAKDVLFIGRGRMYPIALEGALKLKEISYIHAEAYAAGELKHGAIALVDEHVPIVCLCPNDATVDKTLSNMQEVMTRKGQVILLAEPQTCNDNKTSYQINMAAIHPLLSPMLYTIVLQLLSYYTAVSLGKDVDQPRNLAKSVTVE